MTTIRPTPAPTLEGEFRPLSKERANRGLAALVVVSTLVLTVVNLVAAVYLYRASRQVSAVEKRLEELAGFEKRIRDNIDLVNTGIHAQFDNLNHDFRSKFNEIRAGIERAEHSAGTRQAETEMDYRGAPESDIAIEPANEPVPAKLAEAADDPANNPAPAAKTASPSRQKAKAGPFRGASSAYQRIESPDGKVYFKRVD